jgi:hypothetical protein
MRAIVSRAVSVSSREGVVASFGPVTKTRWPDAWCADCCRCGRTQIGSGWDAALWSVQVGWGTRYPCKSCAREKTETDRGLLIWSRLTYPLFIALCASTATWQICVTREHHYRVRDMMWRCLSRAGQNAHHPPWPASVSEIT